MIITIGDETKANMKILEIEEYPFTSTTIKSHYRLLLLKYHPDHNKNGEEKTKQIIEAYKSICHLAIDIDDKTKKEAELKIEKESEDMFNFYEPCKWCSGIGYNLVSRMRTIGNCPKCNSYRFSSFNYFDSFFTIGRCRSCKGTGKFRQSRSKHIVQCRDCKGTGTCFSCNGSGYIASEKQSTKVNCYHCEGTGKIKLDLFNPVIPKGAVL